MGLAAADRALHRVIERHQPLVGAGAAVADEPHEVAVVVGQPRPELGLDRGDARVAERRAPAVAVMARAEAGVARVVAGQVCERVAQRVVVVHAVVGRRAHPSTVIVTRRRCGVVRCSHR